LNMRISPCGSSRSIRRAASNPFRRGISQFSTTPHLGGASDRFLAIGGGGANFPPVRSDEGGKADADDGVIIGDDDTRDANR
jgi:hypothetical protein